jgi:hypothetical protein
MANEWKDYQESRSVNEEILQNNDVISIKDIRNKMGLLMVLLLVF